MVTKSILKDRVRIRKDDIDSEVEEDTQTDLYSDQDVEGHVNEDDIEDSDGSILAEDDDVNSEEDNEDHDSDESDMESDLKSISFGALAKANAQLSSLKRKRHSQDDDDNDSDSESSTPAQTNDNRHSSKAVDSDRLTAIKQQIRQVKSSNPSLRLPSFSASASTNTTDSKRSSSKPYSKPIIEKRSSKHAPQEVSSKKPVSRRRDVMDLPKNTTRDPRFDSLGNGAPVDEHKIARNYAFLEDYREDEMRVLKEEVKKEKDEDRKWELEQRLKSMESRKYTTKRKREEEDILRDHKKKEREAVKQGKKPFFLKKADQKKLILTTKFGNMGEKQRDKAIEKKRKKKASKEKKNMPWARREV